MTKAPDNSWKERFKTDIVPILEHPLYEHNFTEGHENPKLCVQEDIKKVEAFIDSERRIAQEEYEEKIISKLGMMRQWLNEDRVVHPTKMVTTEELAYWLNIELN